MNAKEHYAAAESFLENANDAWTGEGDHKAAKHFYAAAHIHALLAQAATDDPTLAIEDMAEWSPGLSADVSCVDVCCVLTNRHPGEHLDRDGSSWA